MESQNSSSHITDIYRSRNIVLELMGEQGYNIEDYEDFSVEEVQRMKTNNQLDMILEKKTPDPQLQKKTKVYIRYYLAKTLRPQYLQEMIDDLFNIEEVLTKDDTLYIIVKENMNASNETMINMIKHIWEQDGIFIILQSLPRLKFNPLKHYLVPKHRIIGPEEVEYIKKRFNIMDRSQYPNISRFDRAAQAIGIRPGQICEIIRPSKTAIEGFYYRICD
jgi:DNA-directed RNA polymerase subunit H (RpoH/RPB5)